MNLDPKIRSSGGCRLKRIVTLIESERYRSILGSLSYELDGSVLNFDAGGSIAVAVYGRKIIGRGFDLCIVDDPQAPADSKKARLREECNAYFDASMRPRMNKSGEGRVLVIQQRLHANDLSGHLADSQEWKKLAIPAVAPGDERWAYRNGTIFRPKGAPISEARQSLEDLLGLLAALGGIEFQAQYQQAPYPGEDPPEAHGFYGWKIQVDGTVTGPELMRITEARVIYNYLFGGGERFSSTNPNQLTLEEWSRDAAVQQAKLLGSSSREKP